MNYLYQTETEIETAPYLLIVLAPDAAALKWQGKCIKLRNSDGLYYLVELLLHPYCRISAVNLYRLVHHSCTPQAYYDKTGDDYSGNLPSLPLTDEKTIQAVRRRLVKLEELLAEAESWHDYSRADDLRQEEDKLIEYLKETITSFNIPAGSKDEDYRCRDTVYQCLKRVFQQVSRSAPELSAFLQQSISTWSDLIYVPSDNFSVIIMEKTEKKRGNPHRDKKFTLKQRVSGTERG